MDIYSQMSAFLEDQNYFYDVVFAMEISNYYWYGFYGDNINLVKVEK